MSKNRNSRNAKRLVKSGALGQDTLYNTTAFRQVAGVLGGSAARRELLRLPEHVIEFAKRRPSVELSGLFTWYSTPQGNDFWRDIHVATTKEAW